MAFDERIAQLRKSAGMSQEELAQELNISRQAIYKWETGQSLPDIENLKLLAQIFRVSIDSLLNDGNELAQSSALNVAKPQYGEVTRSSLTPADVDVEKDNTRRTEDEALQITLRRVAIFLSGICGFGAAIAGFIILITDRDAVEPGTLFALLFLGLACICLMIFFIKVLFKKAYRYRAYFFSEKEAVEKAMKEKQFWFAILQPDLLAWFFFDPNRKSFGFLFKGKEQFVCPIQNYFSIECTQGGGGITQGDGHLYGGPILGGLSMDGFVLGSAPTYVRQEDNFFHYILTYFDEYGDDQEYSFFLSTQRVYVSDMTDSTEEQINIQNLYSIGTKDAFNKIKNKLELEKKKLY